MNDATTMTRTQRQRVKRYSHHRRNNQETGFSFQEKIILQCIVCGTILAIFMFANVIDTKPTNAMMSWLKGTLNQQTSSDSILKTASDIGSSIQSFFSMGSKQTAGEQEQSTPAPFDSTPSNQTPSVSSPSLNQLPAVQTAPSPDQTRIDEDILNEINQNEDFYNIQNGETNKMDSDAQNLENLPKNQ